MSKPIFAQRWKISGFADPRNNKVDIQIFNKDTGAIKVPYFDERYNLKSSFNSIKYWKYWQKWRQIAYWWLHFDYQL
jgi:hypothetical protein